jgi:glycosyltransferase involved in cell wall biosynthesis
MKSVRTTPTKSVVLIGGDISDGGGANRVIRDLATIFSGRLGLDVTVVARTTNAPSYPFPPQVRIEPRPDAATPKGFRKLLKELSRRDVDYMIGFWHWDNIRIALASRFWGKASIVTEHTSWHHPPLKTRLARAIAYRSAKKVCVLNDADFNHYRRYLRNVELVPNPVPPMSKPGVAKEKLIVGVGHLIDRKNFRDAVLAMSRAGIAEEGWRLVLIGSGPEKDALDRLIQELGLTGSVRIEQTTSDIASWYNRASILLLPSKIDSLPLVLLESMECGVVPLAYACDGATYTLKDHQDLIVPVGDVEGLSAKLRDMARSATLQTRADEMRDVIAQRFSEAAIAERWRALFDD